jgi:hypothetical protein
MIATNADGQMRCLRKRISIIQRQRGKHMRELSQRNIIQLLSLDLEGKWRNASKAEDDFGKLRGAYYTELYKYMGTMSDAIA